MPVRFTLGILLWSTIALAPPIHFVRFSDNTIQFEDYRGTTRTLLASAIPSGSTTIAQVETYINSIWIPANVSGYQMQVHVFSLNPLRVTVWTGNIGIPIPANWWQ